MPSRRSSKAGAPAANDAAGALLERVRSQLAGVGQVAEKRAFGGTVFMVRGHMCVTVSPRGLMVRVGPEEGPKLSGTRGASTMVMQGRKMLAYLRVKSDEVGTPAKLRFWIDKALKFNATLAAK